MEKKYILEYKVSGTLAVQVIATNNPFAVMYHVLDWAARHQHNVYSVSVHPNEIPF